MTTVALVRGLSKRFGRKLVLEDVDLTIAAGEVVGLIGPNGAGKTTLIRLLAGLDSSTSGNLVVNGHSVDARRGPPPGIGLMPERPGFVEHATGSRNLHYLASIRGEVQNSDVDATLELCGLSPADRRPVSKYSLGMRQRLNLAQAILERPQLLILDEPTNGLDPLGIRDLRRIIREVTRAGAGVLVASHLLTEVENACDRTLVINRGRIIDELTSADLARLSGSVEITVSDALAWEAVTTKYEIHSSGADGQWTGTIVSSESVPTIVRNLVAAGVSIERIERRRPQLEDLMIQALENDQ